MTSPFTLPRGKRPRALAVALRGFQTFRAELVPTADRRVVVALEPLPRRAPVKRVDAAQRPPAPAAKPPEAAAPVAAPHAKSPAPKPPGLELDTNYEGSSPRDRK